MSLATFVTKSNRNSILRLNRFSIGLIRTLTSKCALLICVAETAKRASISAPFWEPGEYVIVNILSRFKICGRKMKYTFVHLSDTCVVWVFVFLLEI